MNNKNNPMTAAAAQEAVAWQVGDDFYTSESLAIEGIQQWGPSGSIAIPLYATPVTAEPADAEEDAYVIDQMGKLLAEIAVIVNGPEPAGTRWSYHDLPAKVKALASTPAAPGIDLEQFREAVTYWRDTALRDMRHQNGPLHEQVVEAQRLLALIDASPKSDSCATCNGHGMVGGLLSAGGGYESEPCPDCSPKGGSEAAWDDCKVAFGFDGGEEAIWDAWKRGKLSLPPGWSFSETDGAGARMVAVFRVDGITAPQDGETVRGLLNMLAATQAGDAEVQP